MTAPDATWRKSSFSDQGNGCVEVRITDHDVAIRDTKLAPNSPVIHFSHAEWAGWVAAVAAGSVLEVDFDAPVTVTHDSSFWHIVDRRGGTHLTFTMNEWDAFQSGIVDRQFVTAAA